MATLNWRRGRNSAWLAAAIGCAAACGEAVGAGYPFTWSPWGSYIGIMTLGDGSDGDLYSFDGSPVIPFVAGIGGAWASAQFSFGPGGVYASPSLGVMTIPNLASATASINGKLIFTPTVPNLSYAFNGNVSIVQSGSAEFSAACTVTLNTEPFSQPELYGHYYVNTGSCTTWAAGQNQYGNVSGALAMGQQYIMSWVITLSMQNPGGLSGSYMTAGEFAPYFQFSLYRRPCPGDFTEDGMIDDSDFVHFAHDYDVFDCNDSAMAERCPSDLNHDTVVDDADFVLFVTGYDNVYCP